MQNIKSRQEALLEIVGTENIFSQEELIEKMNQRGIATTQATLSRDLKALSIRKLPGEGYKLSHAARPASPSVVNGIIRVEISFPLAVIRTQEGYAAAVATYLDQHPTDSILGTLAGDDTVLLGLRQGYTPDQVIAALEKSMPGIINRVTYPSDN
jgi:transcriptional regulator of arginine metabolism